MKVTITIPARWLKNFHAISMGVWLLLCIPTLLYWSESVPWLVFMSIYAIITGHFASWQSSRIEVKEEKREK